ncbi:MAG: dihydrofolate reductase family protein [Bacteroidota bacterium]|nr:dihydrofolate reductase family protein [Bacteroidota bacterium]
MRKVIFQMMISLDGFFEGPNSDISWHKVDEEFNNYAIGFLNEVDTLLFGRLTYELMQGYWPTPGAIKNDPIVAEKMNSLSKIVFSKTLSNAVWNNTRLVRKNIANEVLALKQKPGKDMAIFGSSNLALTFIKHGLIDEYRVFVSPLVLGKGKTLFSGIKDRLNLKLLDVSVFNSGNVLLYYQPGQQVHQSS